jgi:hypothetical protein
MASVSPPTGPPLVAVAAAGTPGGTVVSGSGTVTVPAGEDGTGLAGEDRTVLAGREGTGRADGMWYEPLDDPVLGPSDGPDLVRIRDPDPVGLGLNVCVDLRCLDRLRACSLRRWLAVGPRRGFRSACACVLLLSSRRPVPVWLWY